MVISTLNQKLATNSGKTPIFYLTFDKRKSNLKSLFPTWHLLAAQLNPQPFGESHERANPESAYMKAPREVNIPLEPLPISILQKDRDLLNWGLGQKFGRFIYYVLHQITVGEDTMKRDCFICVVLSVILSVIAAQAPVATAAEIKVFTAWAGVAVFEKIGPEFERTTGHKLNVISGFGPIFAKQIKAGESFDILISTPPTINGLVKNGKIMANPTNLFRAGIGVEVRAGAPKPDISSVDAFKRTLLNAKSVGYLAVGGVPQMIERLGIADAMKPKVTIPDNDIVSELVAKGEVELGVVPITQILTKPGVELVGPLPPEIQFYTVFTAGVSVNSKAPDAAGELIKFIRGPRALSAIKAVGMEQF
jgi:molybdate transport system substrate-binding protein